MSNSQVGPERRAASAYCDILIVVALLVATLTIYAQVIGHQFINLDDPEYITQNPMVIRGLTLPGVAHAFTSFTAANWHPLTWISHMIDCQLFGLNAGRHLFVNALLHSVNSVLVFWLLFRATPGGGPLAKRVRCGVVRVTSVARRIRRVGRRTQRHARDIFGTALACRLCSLCEGAIM